MYMNEEEDPDFLFVIEKDSDQIEVDKIQKIVDGMNHDLEDSGFGQYKYYVEIIGNKVYVRRDIKLL